MHDLFCRMPPSAYVVMSVAGGILIGVGIAVTWVLCLIHWLPGKGGART